MMWDFEHRGEDGRIYFHHQNWENFVLAKEKEYPHNRAHVRALIAVDGRYRKLEDARSREVAAAGTRIIKLSNIDVVDDFSVIFDIYPRHLHPHYDIDDSWIMFIEDGHQPPTLGEKVTIYGTDYNLQQSSYKYAHFWDHYWPIVEFSGGFPGPHPAPAPPKKTRHRFRSLDD